MSLLRTTVVIVGLAAATFALKPDVAHAYIARCDKPSGNYFQGYFHDVGKRTEHFEGVSASSEAGGVGSAMMTCLAPILPILGSISLTGPARGS